MIGVSFTIASKVGFIKNKIYKTDNTKLLITADKGENWISKDFHAYISDILIDENRVIVLLNNFTIQVSNNLKDYKEIKLNLFNSNKFIPNFSKLSIKKINNYYYLILKETSSSNFNMGYIFKSSNLKDFKKIYSGDLNKYSFPKDKVHQHQKIDSKLKEVQDNYCETINNHRECFINKKIILIKNGEEIVIDEIKKNSNLEYSKLENGYYKTEQYYTEQGFDKCAVASIPELQEWWNTSPYRVTNLYIGGKNVGCKQQNKRINKDYVENIKNIGWKVIPTWVGYQANCTEHNYYKMSLNNSYNEGVSEANSAINRLRELNLDINQNGDGGGIIYYDLEQFNTNNQNCLNSVVEFIKGWSITLKNNNILSGFYTSGSTLQNLTQISDKIDAVWVAQYLLPYKYRSNINTNSNYMNNSWSSNRIKQYAGGHNERWGNIAMNIDSNAIHSKIFSNKNLISGIFDGAGSLVSPNEKCWGCDRDEARMQIHPGTGSTVVFQWLYDPNSCSQIDLLSKYDIDVAIKAKGWNDHTTKKAFKVKLGSKPVTLTKPSDSDWTTLAITSINELNKMTPIYAYCKTNGDTYNSDNREDIDKDLVDVTYDYYWTGTGSLITFAQNRPFSHAGIGLDYAITFNRHNSLTSFQWYASDSCKKVKITGYNEVSSPINEVKIKEWAEKDWSSNKCDSSLPCTITAPSTDAYYIIKIKSNPNAIASGYLQVSCVE